MSKDKVQQSTLGNLLITITDGAEVVVSHISVCVSVWRVAFKGSCRVLVLICRQLPDEWSAKSVWMCCDSWEAVKAVCECVCVCTTAWTSHTDEHNTQHTHWLPTAKLSKLDQVTAQHTTHQWWWYWADSTLSFAANGWHLPSNGKTWHKGWEVVWLKTRTRCEWDILEWDTTVTLNWPTAQWTSTWESKVFSGNKSLPFGITFKLVVMSDHEDKITWVWNQFFL